MKDISEQIQVSTFAPVIIPTLCRYEHFRACLESLSRCTWANKTDVFIGLDYPAKESHWNGYNKIKAYLQSNQKKLNFKSFNVIERERNYGFGPHGNFRELRFFVLNFYDRLIASEDDNVFSPNFLVFMNRGLEKFKDDKSVLALNGYRHFYPIKCSANTFIRQNVDFSAWGYGIWKDRIKMFDHANIHYFTNKFSLKSFFDLRKENGNNRALNFSDYAFGWNGIMSDSPMSVYAKLENMDIIMPAKVSLVRNMGWDNSGEHCLNNESLKKLHVAQPISEDSDFDYVGTGKEYYEENRKVFRESSYARISNKIFWKRFIKVLAQYILMKLHLLKSISRTACL